MTTVRNSLRASAFTRFTFCSTPLVPFAFAAGEPREGLFDNMLTCKICGLTKPLSGFLQSRSSRLGVFARCKKCRRTPESRESYRVRMSIGRKATLKRYCMTEAEYDVLFYRQNGKCAICKKGHHKKLYVDHCHKTKIVRGLLCPRCNSGLGLLGDSAELLSVALEYICRTEGVNP